MNRIEKLSEVFPELFKASPNSGEGSDPEMMAILQRSIFGEVFTIGTLSIADRELITIVILTAQQAQPQLKSHINAALNAGVTPIELREAIYLTAPFIGFPRTLNAVSTLNEAFEENDISLPLENQSTVDENTRLEKGLEIQGRLYGDEIKQQLASLPDGLGEKTADLLTGLLFGDFYTRSTFDIATKELLGLCVLTASNTDEGVLISHITANLKIGTSPSRIAAAIIHCAPYTGFPTALKTLYALQKVMK